MANKKCNASDFVVNFYTMNFSTDPEVFSSQMMRCVEKYDYTGGEKAFIEDSVKVIFKMIEVLLKKDLCRKYSLSSSVDRNIARLADDMVSNKQRFFEIMLDCVDYQLLCRLAPGFYGEMRKEVSTKHGLPKEFLLKECEEMMRINLEEVMDFSYDAAAEFLTGRERAIVAHGTLTRDSLWNEKRKTLEKCDAFLQKYKPHVIKAFLDRHIIGQENAKIAVANTLYFHVKEIAHHLSQAKKEGGAKTIFRVKKNNILLIGPSGSGKTELFRVLRQISPVSIMDVNTPSITNNGFVGDELMDVLSELKKRFADFEYGIILFDEFDKIVTPEYSSKGENVNATLQGDFLKALEGGEFHGGRNSMVDTNYITFVCAGAFQNLLDDCRGVQVRGFADRDEEKPLLKQSTIEHALIQYGMMPEILRRLGKIVMTKPLGKEELKQIFYNVEHTIFDTCADLLEEDHLQLRYTEEAVETLLEKSMGDQLGASKMEGIFRSAVELEAFYAMRDCKKDILITKDSIMKACTY